MENIIAKRLFGGTDPHLRVCALEQPSELGIEKYETDMDTGESGTFSHLQFLVVSTLKDVVMEGGAIVLAFLAVGCVALIMFYMVNGIYVLSYILIQLTVGDGKSTSTENRNLIYQLIFDQILLHRLWRRGSSSGSSNVINSSTSKFMYDRSRRPPLNNLKFRINTVTDKDRTLPVKSFSRIT